ncbi:hypothetical protein Dimus_000209 [Dionaea muscipula]
MAEKGSRSPKTLPMSANVQYSLSQTHPPKTKPAHLSDLPHLRVKPLFSYPDYLESAPGGAPYAQLADRVFPETSPEPPHRQDPGEARQPQSCMALSSSTGSLITPATDSSNKDSLPPEEPRIFPADPPTRSFLVASPPLEAGRTRRGLPCFAISGNVAAQSPPIADWRPFPPSLFFSNRVCNVDIYL